MTNVVMKSTPHPVGVANLDLGTIFQWRDNYYLLVPPSAQEPTKSRGVNIHSGKFAEFNVSDKVTPYDAIITLQERRT